MAVAVADRLVPMVTKLVLCIMRDVPELIMRLSISYTLSVITLVSVSQVESYLKDAGMAGLVSAWAMARRRPI